jgi:hypothetical protein
MGALINSALKLSSMIYDRMRNSVAQPYSAANQKINYHPGLFKKRAAATRVSRINS